MISILAIDFDETVTLRDTTPNLPELAASALNDADAVDLRRRWLVGARAYYADWQRVYDEALAASAPADDTYAALVRFSTRFDAIEQSSIASVIDGGFLRGIRRDRLHDLGGAVPKRDGVLETLADCAGLGIDLHVISANWSADLVRAGIGGLGVPIHSNDLDFDEREVSTGHLHRRVVSGTDKAERFRSLNSGAGLRMFVGDSVTDLVAMLDADVGVLIGGKASAVAVCERVGIPLEPLKSARPPRPGYIYVVETWEEIRRFLSDASA
ncbi:hypothetical protein FJZ36_07910 [Candidatus Poribacteria bacterium]|nr:hypothetical protein [Candidatus Poribacteria bacterium]